jgi:hypothetical protein
LQERIQSREHYATVVIFDQECVAALKTCPMMEANWLGNVQIETFYEPSTINPVASFAESISGPSSFFLPTVAPWPLLFTAATLPVNLRRIMPQKLSQSTSSMPLSQRRVTELRDMTTRKAISGVGSTVPFECSAIRLASPGVELVGGVVVDIS